VEADAIKRAVSVMLAALKDRQKEENAFFKASLFDSNS
jgi:hypothetical protein